MNTQATVRLWGTDIGYVSLADDQPIARFEYNPAFLHSGIEVYPLRMPLARQRRLSGMCRPWCPAGGRLRMRWAFTQLNATKSSKSFA